MGDRHLAEFFPGFLSEASGRGDRYGVLLTTVEHRAETARGRRARREALAQGGSVELVHSDETLARSSPRSPAAPPAGSWSTRRTWRRSTISPATPSWNLLRRWTRSAFAPLL